MFRSVAAPISALFFITYLLKSSQVIVSRRNRAWRVLLLAFLPPAGLSAACWRGLRPPSLPPAAGGRIGSRGLSVPSAVVRRPYRCGLLFLAPLRVEAFYWASERFFCRLDFGMVWFDLMRCEATRCDEVRREAVRCSFAPNTPLRALAKGLPGGF